MLRRRADICLLFLSVSLSGCVAKPFQPNPDEYSLWRRSGTATDDIKRNMMECGFLNSYTSFGMSEESYAKAEVCMINRGFTNTDGIMCSKEEYQRRLATCQAVLESGVKR